MQQPISTFLGIAAAVVLASNAAAGIINVPVNHSTIQAAVAAAVDGDEIVVAPGTYNEAIVIDAKAITVRSSDGPEVTIIDATGLFASVVRLIGSPIGPDTFVDGFTITGGDAVEGGGMETGGSMTVSNCIFIGNVGDRGGGMFNGNGTSPMVTNCTFVGNSASGSGGGMFNKFSSPTIVNCTFNNNIVGQHGGGMHNFMSDPTIVNCVFIENNAALGGGGVFNATSNARLINCTVSSNTAGLGGGVFNSSFSFPVITNSILWDNAFGQIIDSDSLSIVSYSDVQDGWPGLGSNNTDAVPLFVDPANGDFQLQPGSPAIDAGHNWAVPSDSSDLDGDGDMGELTALDLDGSPRFADDSGTIDSGCGASAVVDMGAYEFPGKALSCLRPGDVNGDGTINVLDLIDLLLAFGVSCEVECCLADFNTDGSVDVLDLIELLLAFGQACP